MPLVCEVPAVKPAEGTQNAARNRMRGAAVCQEACREVGGGGDSEANLHGTCAKTSMVKKVTESDKKRPVRKHEARTGG